MFVGAVFAGIVWTVLQALGGYFIGHRLETAKETYGFFAVVIGLLTWIYLGAQVTLLGAEMNVVPVWRLWPRVLDPGRMMEADERALRDHAKVEERREEETVPVQSGDQGGAGDRRRRATIGGGAPGHIRVQQRRRGERAAAPIHRRGHLHAGEQTDRAREAGVGEMVGTRAKAVGVFGAAAVLGLFVIGFLGMAGAEALDLVLPRWAAMLIVAGVFGVLAAVAIVLARGWLARRIQARATQESLKEDVRWAKQQLKR